MKLSSILVWLNLVRLYPGFMPLNLSMFIGGRLVDFLFLTVILYCSCTGEGMKLQRITLFLIFLAMLIWFLGMMHLSGGIAGHSNVTIRDFFEPHRLLILALILVYASNSQGLLDLKLWNRFWIWSLLLFALIVALRVSGTQVGDFVVDLLWGASKDKFVAERLLFRQTGFFVNPNWAGVYLAWALAYFLFMRPLKTRQNTLLIFLCVALTLMSGSRTGLLCSTATILAWLIWDVRFKGGVIWCLAVAFSLLAIPYDSIISFLPLHQRELISSLVNSGDITEVSTFADRIEIWRIGFETYFYERPIFGSGPLKSSVGSVLDSQYVKWLVWYGMVGTFIHAIFFFSLYRLTRRLSKRERSEESQFGRWVTVMFLIIAIAGVTGAFFDVTQLAFLLILCSGVVVQLSTGSLMYGVDRTSRLMSLQMQLKSP